MRLVSLLFTLFVMVYAIPAFGQKKAKVDTVAAFRAFQEGRSLEKAAKYDLAIIHYQVASEGYKAYALSLPDKQKWVAARRRAWEQHFSAQDKIALSLTEIGQTDSALKLLLADQLTCNNVLGDSSVVKVQIEKAMANIYYERGEYLQALNLFKEVLAMNQQIHGEQNAEVAYNYYNIGLLCYLQGQYRKALEHFQQSIAIQIKLLGENHRKVADCYNFIGVILFIQGHYETALEYHQKALSLRLQVFGQQHSEVASSYSNIGMVYCDQGQYVQALKYHQKALSIRQLVISKQSQDLAQSYANVGLVYHLQGQYELALDYYQHSLGIFKKSLGENHSDVALNYQNIGNIYSEQGYFGQAMEYYQLSLAINKRLLGDQHPELASIYISLALDHKNQGQYGLALNYLMSTIAILKQAYGDQYPQLAFIYGNMGLVYKDQGQTGQALEYLNQALMLFKKDLGEHHPNVASSYNHIGSVYESQGQYNLVIEAHKKSLQAYLPNYATAGYNSMLCSSPDVLKYPLSSLPHALIRRNTSGDDSLALAAVRFSDKLIDSLRRAYTYENDKLELGKDANQLYQIAIDVASWNKLDEEAFYYSEKNKAAVLSQSLNEAVALKLGGIPDSLLEKDKELRTLVAFYAKASIDEELNCPKCDSTKLSNIKNGLFTYQQQQAALKARLESEFPQYFALKYKDAKISVMEIQQGFLADNPNSAILEYLLGDSVLYAFCITKDQYSFHRQKLDSTRFKMTNALQLEIKKLGRALADAKSFLDPTTVVSQPASALYDYLIKPFEQQIKGKDLIIIPDGELNKIPFELLIKPNPNLKAVSRWQELPYLIKQHNISYHYSAHLLMEDWKKNKTQPVKSNGFVAFAPVFDDTSTGQIVSNENVIEKSYLAYVSREDTLSRAFTNDGRLITPLPGTEREVKAIYELFTQQNQPAKYYLNDQANESTVKSINLKPYKYLHFATHGLTDEDRPTNSCLILAQNPTPNPSPNGEGSASPDNLLTSSEMYGLELDAELVVLSACQTGKGTLKAGEGIIGLTRGLLYAGARNLLVSQWNVNDASTAELMTKFYAKILSGQSNSQALREAKLELLNSKFACPHYWSAFVLVGR
jgi:CHAT domain-containing protein/Tfp pilus assembly protein PilF